MEVENSSVGVLGVVDAEHELAKKRLLEDAIELDVEDVLLPVELLLDPSGEADTHVDGLPRNDTDAVRDGVDHGAHEQVAMLDVASKRRLDDRQLERMSRLELLRPIRTLLLDSRRCRGRRDAR